MPRPMTKKKARTDIEDFLTAITMLQNSTPDGKDRPSVEKFILENGRYFKPAPLPRNIPHGDIHSCFENAFLLAVKNKTKYFYCEGYATTGLLPTLHAWGVTADGKVIDPTWCPDGSNEKMEYFGIAFDWDYITKQFKSMKHFGLINDAKRKWPLLRGEKDFRSKKF
jgi:hypothetical protein